VASFFKLHVVAPASQCEGRSLVSQFPSIAAETVIQKKSCTLKIPPPQDIVDSLVTDENPSGTITTQI
jgi:hypothetical protein